MFQDKLEDIFYSGYIYRVNFGLYSEIMQPFIKYLGIVLAIVYSRNYFLLENNDNDSAYMRKLNRRKIRWIVGEMDKEELSVYWIAKIQGITPQWA